MERDEALAWFLAGFAESGEGFNPNVLTDWDDEDHPVREAFDEQWPNPEHEDMVRTAEEHREFTERVEKDGLYGALPKAGTGITFDPDNSLGHIENRGRVVDDEQPSGVIKEHESIVDGPVTREIKSYPRDDTADDTEDALIYHLEAHDTPTQTLTVPEDELDGAGVDVESIVAELDGDDDTDEREVCPDFYCGNWADECEKH